MLQATVYGRLLDDSLLTQSFGIKPINVRPSNKQTVTSEHLFETMIKPIVTTVAQKDIRFNYYASWLRLCREQDNVHMNTKSVQCISTVYSIYVRINIISELFRPIEKKSNSSISNCTTAIIL